MDTDCRESVLPSWWLEEKEEKEETPKSSNLGIQRTAEQTKGGLQELTILTLFVAFMITEEGGGTTED